MDRIVLDEKRIDVASYVDIVFLFVSLFLFCSSLFLLDIFIVLSFMTSPINVCLLFSDLIIFLYDLVISKRLRRALAIIDLFFFYLYVNVHAIISYFISFVHILEM